MDTADTINRLNTLIQLDYDASKTYEQAASHIDVSSVRQEINSFHDDHLRHIQNLSALIRDLGGTPIEPARDLKGMLLEGYTMLRSSSGTEGALRALENNEQITNREYHDASVLDIPPAVKTVIDSNFDDEKRHLQYIVRSITAKVWERGTAIPSTQGGTSGAQSDESMSRIRGETMATERTRITPNSLFDNIREDHSTIIGMINEIKQTGDGKTREVQFDNLRKGTISHMSAEEDTFYDTLRRKDKAYPDTLKSLEEHHIVYILLDELSEKLVDSDAWMPQLNVVQDILTHHIQEEESTMFDLAKELFTDEEFADVNAHYLNKKQRIDNVGLAAA